MKGRPLSLSKFLAFLIVFSSPLALVANGLAEEESLVINKAERKTDLTGAVVRQEVTLKVENVGSTIINRVAILVPPFHSRKTCIIFASQVQGKGKSRRFVDLRVSRGSAEEEAELAQRTSEAAIPGGAPELYFVELLASLAPQQSVNLQYYYPVSEVIEPFPTEISQLEVQLARYFDSHFLLSPYNVKSQSAVFILLTRNVESFAEKKPSTVVNNEVKLGPYESAPPLSFSEFYAHYEHNRPLPIVDSLVREFEISSWGSVSVVEEYKIRNAGAKLKGGFSRYDFQMHPGHADWSIRGFRATLPPSAHSLFFRDDIGNISSSNFRSSREKSELEMNPRFPLLGGWHTVFQFGFSLPLSSCVYNAPNTSPPSSFLNVSFGTPFGDIHIKKMQLRIVLPERSVFQTFNFPYAVKHHLEKKFSLLDSVGRTVLVLERENLSGEFTDASVHVYYTTPPFSLLGKPLLLSLSFLLVFSLFILCVRLDLSIDKTGKAYLERRRLEEVSDCLKNLLSFLSSRLSLLTSADSLLLSLGRTADVTSARAAKKTWEAQAKEVEKKMKVERERMESSLAGNAVSASMKNLVDLALKKDRELFELSLSKITLSIEAYEKKLSVKEINAKVAPVQERSVQIKKEIKALMRQME